MARHKAPRTPTVRRTLAVLATASVALGTGAATAAAADSDSLLDDTGQAVGTVADLKPNPLAGTGVDPLDNGVGTQVADFRAVDSREVTGPVAQARSQLPVRTLDARHGDRRDRGAEERHDGEPKVDDPEHREQPCPGERDAQECSDRVTPDPGRKLRSHDRTPFSDFASVSRRGDPRCSTGSVAPWSRCVVSSDHSISRGSDPPIPV